jgi:hypothetical protein
MLASTPNSSAVSATRSMIDSLQRDAMQKLFEQLYKTIA